MKKLSVTLSLAVLVLPVSTTLAAWGLFDVNRSFIGINVGGTTNNYTVWSGGTGNFNGSVLSGTPFTSSAQTLQINYYDVKTFKNGGSDVTGGTFFWTVYETGNRGTPSYSSIGLGFQQNLPGAGDQQWGFASSTASILSSPNVSFTSGLKNYTFEFYVQVNGLNPNGSVFDNNNNNPSNYTATFQTIPEPSTYALLALGGAALGSYLLRRRSRHF